VKTAVAYACQPAQLLIGEKMFIGINDTI